jgi:hypothetical protein
LQQHLIALGEVAPQRLSVIAPHDRKLRFPASSLSPTIAHGGFLFLEFLGRQTRFSRIHQETAAFNLQLHLGHRRPVILVVIGPARHDPMIGLGLGRAFRTLELGRAF